MWHLNINGFLMYKNTSHKDQNIFKNDIFIYKFIILRLII